MHPGTMQTLTRRLTQQFIPSLCRSPVRCGTKYCEMRLDRYAGTAIWVYGIMLNSLPSPTVTLTNVSFTLDGAASGRFVHVPHPKTEELEYNVTIYNKTELENAEHTLVMTVMQDPNPSVLLFDWAMYT